MVDVIRWLNASTSSRDEEMFAGLYAELYKIARGRMAGERPEETPEATGLVHEAWLRLEKSAPEEWQNRKHFYGAADESRTSGAGERVRCRSTKPCLSPRRCQTNGFSPSTKCSINWRRNTKWMPKL